MPDVYTMNITPRPLTTPRVGIYKIDPPTAEKLLGYNTHNRPLRTRMIDGWVHDMQAGRWSLNGESIKVAHDGTLLDGQNRLTAVTKSNTTQQFVVVDGLAPETQNTVDVGARRRFGDVLKIDGSSNYANLAAITRVAFLWSAGTRKGLASGGGGGLLPTNPELQIFLNKHPELEDSAAITTKVWRELNIPPSTGGLCHWLFTNLDAQRAEAFFDSLMSGVNLDHNDPIWHLRRTLLQPRTGTQRINKDTLLALIIKTWNAYRDGASMKYLRYRAQGDKPESFPEPR